MSIIAYAGGSSPQARGTRLRFAAWPLSPRFIPAGAGNTAPSTWRGYTPPVHPRRRGEHLDCRCARILLPRFIPAGAGNTFIFFISLLSIMVHPRRRGEHAGVFRRRNHVDGSSPQARGTRAHAGDGPLHCRFIPAGAGNTTMSGSGGDGTSVHPRRRGEHHFSGHRILVLPGSSPQARGTRPECFFADPPVRFIPAGAGNTTWCSPGPGRSTVHPRRRGEHSVDACISL